MVMMTLYLKKRNSPKFMVRLTNVTIDAGPTRQALALVSIDEIRTQSSILTGITGALVDINLAVDSSPAEHAGTHELVLLVTAYGAIQARKAGALVDICGNINRSIITLLVICIHA